MEFCLKFIIRSIFKSVSFRECLRFLRVSSIIMGLLLSSILAFILIDSPTQMKYSFIIVK